MNKLTKVLQLGLATMVMMGLSSCYKPELEADVPNCIKRKLRKIHRSDVQHASSQLWQWSMDSKTYYLLMNGATRYSHVFNESCEELCEMGGGGPYATSGGCEFMVDESEMTLIWEEPYNR